jgi:hypothetical protein
MEILKTFVLVKTQSKTANSQQTQEKSKKNPRKTIDRFLIALSALENFLLKSTF